MVGGVRSSRPGRDLLFVGPEAERRYGQVHYRDLVAVFTAPPQFQIRHGRTEIGQVDPLVLTRKVDGPRLITLGGRAWRMTYTDWRRRVAYVEPSEAGGDVRWTSTPRADSYAVTDAARRVLLGAEPAGVRLTRRALARLARLREEHRVQVDEGATVVARESTGPVWWTWAGARANAVLVAALREVTPWLVEDESFTNRGIRLTVDASATALAAALRDARGRFEADLAGVLPAVTEDALRGLKFIEMLPPEMAARALAERNADHAGAAEVLGRAVRG